MPTVREKLLKLLGREPSCSRLLNGKYIADFFKYGAPATRFVADTEDQALQQLLDYLEAEPKTEQP